MRAENKRSPKSKSEDGWDEVDAFVAGDHLNERQRRIEKLAAKIMVLWYRCAQAIYDTGVACAREDKRLIPIDKKALLKKLPFSASRFQQASANRQGWPAAGDHEASAAELFLDLSRKYVVE